MRETPKKEVVVTDSRKSVLVSHSLEKLNKGKSSYREYLLEYKAHKDKEAERVRLEKAKQTVEAAHKWEAENGVILDFA